MATTHRPNKRFRTLRLQINLNGDGTFRMTQYRPMRQQVEATSVSATETDFTSACCLIGRYWVIQKVPKKYKIKGVGAGCKNKG